MIGAYERLAGIIIKLWGGKVAPQASQAVHVAPIALSRGGESLSPPPAPTCHTSSSPTKVLRRRTEWLTCKQW